ncbi:MAG: winged helix-turn-helix transcriptional regulator [Methanobacteriota archaeon]|nr:MAG: winged helix-turn-helix transcriptional regulator [Euryarchaeota archaeon]
MDSGGGKITLDQESFRALASDVRVGILKRLDSRRETVTDLSNLLQLSKPTLLEHLEKLQTALPAMRDASPSIGASLIGPLLFLLAVIALACALVIQRVGIRRRERFFQQLGAA